MRIVFCGSGAFAAPALRAVVAAGHEVAAIVTQPPRASGRGGKLTSTPLAQAAHQLQLDVHEFENINAPQSIETVSAARPDVIVVVDFGQFVRAGVRGCAPLGAFNLHGSLLPELRGAAPVNWAIIRGYRRTGVTTFDLVDKMDAGAIYLQAATDVNSDETAEQLRIRLAQIGADLVCRTLDLLAGGKVQAQVQDESKATLAPRLTRADGLIDWSAPAEEIRNRIHGVWPWPAAHAVFFRKDGLAMPVLIERCKIEEGAAEAEAGMLDRDLMVACGQGRLSILGIQPAGKRLMAWKDFLNGYRASEGDKFIRPPG